MLEKLECIPEALATAIENAAHDGDRLTESSCALDLLRRGIGLCKYPVSIAIDGIDELTEQSQKVVCNGLRELVQSDHLPTKLFLTGREDLSSLLAVS